MADATAPSVVMQTTKSDIGQEESLSQIGLGPHVRLALQLGLVMGVALLFRIELERGFGVVAPLIFVGFLIHSRLPLRARLPFFVLLTIVAVAVLLQADAVWLVALGLGLLGLCHLPIAWPARVVILLSAAIALAALQAGWLQLQWPATVIPVLASMFMFRLILYLYSLKRDETPAAPWARVAYFFMLPNVCFPLFPVVDYKTFLRTYYDAPAAEIYQKGVWWILRGIAHLLLYRVVYYYFMPLANSLSGILGVFFLMAMTYALYLRVSGLFHLIAGSLCIFGFNLPVTNNHYFLASSFTDLWRRINIYWKDFMMTVVFYPVFMSVRRWGMSARLVMATGMVFLITWFLHSYQWFWLQGGFPIRIADIVFWGFLGIAVAVNSIWEAWRGRRRPASREWSVMEAARLTGRTMAVFSTMAVLWSLWYSGSLTEWGYRLLRVRDSHAGDWALFVGLVGGVFLAGIGVHWLGTRGWNLARLEGLAWQRASLVVPVLSVTLLIVGLPSVHERANGPVKRMVKRTQSTELNRLDLDRQEHGYYETLTRATQFGPTVADVFENNDEGELLFRHTEAVRRTEDIRGYEIVPGSRIAFRGATFSANRWGLRDREYEKAKPAGTFRAALLGSSHAMGWGVGNDETFENLVEDRLNRELAQRGFKYEILNFAVAGYALPQALYVAEQIVPEFEPDVVIYVAHPREGARLIKRLQILVARMGGELGEYEYVAEVLRKAEVHPGLPPQEFERRLTPYREGLLRWSYQRMLAAIRSYGAVPVIALVPLTNEAFAREEVAQLSRLARELDAVVMTLPDSYDGYDLKRITVSASDNHANALGHRLVADRFFDSLLENAESLGLSPEAPLGGPTEGADKSSSVTAGHRGS